MSAITKAIAHFLVNFLMGVFSYSRWSPEFSKISICILEYTI